MAGVERGDASVSRNEIKSTVIRSCKTMWVDRKSSGPIKKLPQMTFLQSIAWQSPNESGHWNHLGDMDGYLLVRSKFATFDDHDRITRFRGAKDDRLRKSHGIQSTIRYEFKPSNRIVSHLRLIHGHVGATNPWEVRNERKEKQEQKTRKTDRTRSEWMKTQKVGTQKREWLPHIDGTIDEFR
jgi:hypothetical protein